MKFLVLMRLVSNIYELGLTCRNSFKLESLDDDVMVLSPAKRPKKLRIPSISEVKG